MTLKIIFCFRSLRAQVETPRALPEHALESVCGDAEKALHTAHEAQQTAERMMASEVRLMEERVQHSVAEAAREKELAHASADRARQVQGNLEEVLRVTRQEGETLRAHAALAEERSKDTEARRQELSVLVEELRAEKADAASTLQRERQRADASDEALLKLREKAALDHSRLAEELEETRKVKRGLEAQVHALRSDQRKAIVGYCAELAKWQSPDLVQQAQLGMMASPLGGGGGGGRASPNNRTTLRLASPAGSLGSRSSSRLSLS